MTETIDMRARALKIMHILITTRHPKDSSEVPNWLKKVKSLQSVLSDCWQSDPSGNLMVECLNIFYVIIATNFIYVGPAVWSILNIVEKYQISKFVEDILADPLKNDNVKVKNVLLAMIDGLGQCGPYTPRLQYWILAMVQGLETRKNFTILTEVAENEIHRLMQLLIIPLYRPLVYPTFKQFLYPVTTPRVFYKIIDEVPRALNVMQQDANRLIGLDFAGVVVTLLTRFPPKPECEAKYNLIRRSLMNFSDTTFDPDSMMLWDLEKNSRHSDWITQNVINEHVSITSKVPYKGLVNQGNTCYMNSVLQILYMTTRFRKELMEKELHSCEKAASDLQKLFAFMQESNRTVLVPNGVIDSTLPPTFCQGHQQDSSEYLIYLLDILHESETKATCSKSAEEKREGNGDFETSKQYFEGSTIVERLFGGLTVASTSCSFCKKSFPKNEHFRTLHLPVPDDHKSYDLQELIGVSLQLEELCNENMYDCGNCGTKRHAIREHAIVKAPEHLILTLKLFRFDSVMKQRMKLRSRLKNFKAIKLPVFNASQSKSHIVMYDLKGVVIHSGSSLDGGHYLSSAIDKTGQWYTFNDSIVSPAKFEWNTGEGTPYLLFFRQSDVCDPPESPLQSNLQLLVNRDNQRFLTEKRGQKRNFQRKKDDDDRDETPPSNGSLNGPALVF